MKVSHKSLFLIFSILGITAQSVQGDDDLALTLTEESDSEASFWSGNISSNFNFSGTAKKKVSSESYEALQEAELGLATAFFDNKFNVRVMNNFATGEATWKYQGSNVFSNLKVYDHEAFSVSLNGVGIFSPQRPSILSLGASIPVSKESTTPFGQLFLGAAFSMSQNWYVGNPGAVSVILGEVDDSDLSALETKNGLYYSEPKFPSSSRTLSAQVSLNPDMISRSKVGLSYEVEEKLNPVLSFHNGKVHLEKSGFLDLPKFKSTFQQKTDLFVAYPLAENLMLRCDGILFTDGNASHHSYLGKASLQLQLT